MNRLAAVVFLLFALAAPAAMAQAPARLALLIGVSDYNGDGVVDTSPEGVARSKADGYAPDLRNPVNDVTDIAQALRAAGFRVDLRVNATRADMEEGFKALAAAATAAGGRPVVVVYYAGHGVNVGATDFLVPAGARMPDLSARAPLEIAPTTPGQDPSAVQDALMRRLSRNLVRDEEGAEIVGRVFYSLREARRLLPDPEVYSTGAGVGLRVFFLDNCRDNPFAVQNGLQSFMAQRSELALIGLVESPLFIFSASPEQEALDGAGRNSPFATAVRRHIARPNQSLLTMYNAIERDVLAATGGQQKPKALANMDVRANCLISCPPVGASK